MMKNFITILLFSTTAFLTNGAKILGIFPLPGRSHYILGSSLLRELAERGHDVTMISCFSEKEPPKNGTYRDVVVSGLLEAIQGNILAYKLFFDIILNFSSNSFKTDKNTCHQTTS
jgi:hypothetical protein